MSMDPSTSFTVHVEGYLERINNLHNEYEALEDIENTLEQDFLKVSHVGLLHR